MAFWNKKKTETTEGEKPKKKGKIFGDPMVELE